VRNRRDGEAGLFKESALSGLPSTDCLVVAVATPITADLRPDAARLLDHCRWLLEQGCDGVTLFGTTGEGMEFTVADRRRTIEAVLKGGIAPKRAITSIGALAVPDAIELAKMTIDLGLDGGLLMPPCVYRGGITEDGTFRFYARVIEGVGSDDLRIYLYHFPDICGVPITPNVIRRLEERFPKIIAGAKDSGGDIDFTEGLLRRFSHLSIFTGSEIHLPQLLANGLRGTICGLGNVMPRLMRAMFDAGNAFERRKLLPQLLSGDQILSRRPFIPSAKAVLADAKEDAAWRQPLPPMAVMPALEEQRMIADYRRWEASLPAASRSLYAGEPTADPKVVPLRG
jgi:4-hydroxy-tetrahydrodipicolinate synthase